MDLKTRQIKLLEEKKAQIIRQKENWENEIAMIQSQVSDLSARITAATSDILQIDQDISQICIICGDYE